MQTQNLNIGSSLQRMVSAASDFDIEKVTLTEEEKQKAINTALRAALGAKRNREYQKAINQPPVYPNPTKEQLIKMCKDSLVRSVPNYTPNGHFDDILNVLAMYFTGSGEFEQQGENYSLEKGILIWGNVGVGKTTLMRLFQTNTYQPYRLVDVNDLVSKFSQQAGSDVKQKFIYKYGNLFSQKTPLERSVGTHQGIGVCFDDLGTEDDQNDFGKINIMERIFLLRYQNNLPFNCTHVITNLSARQIAERYGERVADRFKQMFNLVAFDEGAKSLRA